jgi:hypothetical protein
MIEILPNFQWKLSIGSLILSDSTAALPMLPVGGGSRLSNTQSVTNTLISVFVFA